MQRREALMVSNLALLLVVFWVMAGQAGQWQGNYPSMHWKHVRRSDKLQALVYDILPSTTAIFSYAKGSTKLSANEQFFVGAQTVVSLLQTTQIKQSMSFIAVIKVYTSTNKTTAVWIETELLFYTGGCVSCLFPCVLWCKVASTVILVPKLQAMVYDILPSTTAVFSYAIGSRKLSANEQFFCWCSDSSKFVTNNLNKTRPGWMRLMFTCVLWR